MRDSFGARTGLPGHEGVTFFSLARAERAGAGALSRLPFCLRALADNLLRHEDGEAVTADDVRALAAWAETGHSKACVAFHPGRILLHDSSGLPVLADLAALAEAGRQAGLPAGALAPRLRADLVVDHAVEVDAWGAREAREANITREFERNDRRYRFLKWAEHAVPGLNVIPPGAGICHQLNLEVLADVASLTSAADGGRVVGTDSVLGTDSHTPMINALSVFGWGVGGIEATMALLGDPVVMPIPDVIGVRLAGRLPAGATATDLALALTAALRERDTVGRFVEFFGDGLESLSLPDRATLANMAPEYGATMGFFPADAATLAYLAETGRAREDVARAEAFLRAQGLMRDPAEPEPVYTEVMDFDLGAVAPLVAGPSRPQERRGLAEVPASVPEPKGTPCLDHGSVVIAAITSCTNTSNPRLMVAAGLLARKAVDLGLRSAPWVKTSLAPGSRTASTLLAATGLQPALDALGFQVVGHGCMTCMGNSGPLAPEIAEAVERDDLAVAAVLSGNRNFEGRVHPACRLAYLASPPLVVAYALAGSMRLDLTREPLGQARDGRPVHLADIWPGEAEIDAALAAADMRALSLAERGAALQGSRLWRDLPAARAGGYAWEGEEGFIRRPPFLDPEVAAPQLGADIEEARALLVLGDNVTTDHISPVSRILPESEAGRWLASRGVAPRDMASFSARRLNHEVMLRGGFANARMRNRLAQGREGGWTRHLPGEEIVPVHEAAAAYAARGTPALVLAGRGYGAGSARDWAAKATRLLGVRAVIAGGFERIHRANLIAFGVLPLQWPDGAMPDLDGEEVFSLSGLPDALRPGGSVTLTARDARGGERRFTLVCRIDTAVEADCLRRGGALPRAVARASAATGDTREARL